MHSVLARIVTVSLLAGALCASAATTAPAEVPPVYRLHDLGPAGWDDEITDLNASLVACGSIEVEAPDDETFTHAALFVEGRRVDLGTLGGNNSYAYSLNDLGQVVGEAQVASGAYHAFLWRDTNANGVSDAGEMRDLGVGNGRASRANCINSQGVIVGEIRYSGSNTGAARWVNGRFQKLTVPGGRRSSAHWIGDDGAVLGQAVFGRRFQPVRWGAKNSGKIIPLKGRRPLSYGLVGKTQSGDIWINLQSFSITFGGVSRPAIKRPGKPRLISLPYEGNGAWIGSVNGLGQAVGSDGVDTFDEEGNPISYSWAVYWQGNSIYDLDELLSPASDFTLEDASAINEAGWIAARAVDDEGEERLALLEPVVAE